MKNKAHILTLMFAVLLLTGCNLIDDAVVDDDTPVDVSLCLSRSGGQQKNTTRQTSDVVQSGSTYRKLTDWHVIPFEVRDRKIAATDQAKRERLGGMAESFDKTNSRFFYTENCTFMKGVASFLVYVRALPKYGDTENPTIAQKIANGSLTAVFPVDMNPSGITFTPDAIYGSNDADAKADALAAYLTAIANTEVTDNNTTYKWSNATTPAMKALYQNFIGQENVAAVDIAASSTNVLKYVNELYTQVNGIKTTASGTGLSICDEILKNISGYAGVTYNVSDGKLTITSLGEAMSGYPENIGLPDGAAVVRWTGSAFEPQTQTTTMDNITGIARYAYPAELYYHANSLIKTSNLDKRKSSYEKATWAGVLDDYENNNGVVTGNTTAVAIIEPLQYGVAHLQVMLKQVASTTLKDAADEDITIGTSYFPLTAIIVGNQHPVGFDFKPSSTEAYFMYDPNVTSGVCLSSSNYQNNSDVSAVSHTLVLQSNDNEEIAMVLEFQNNSEQTIEGVNHGLIYPGTKFYLVAKVKPSDATNENVEKLRVFTQDCITTMTMKVESLAKAYNVLPNLLSPRLEVGVQVITDWMQAEPTNVMLE